MADPADVGKLSPKGREGRILRMLELLGGTTPSGGIPAFITRTLSQDPRSPRTPQNESIRGSIGNVDGKELFFPTIQLLEGELTRFKKKNGDVDFRKTIESILANENFAAFDSVEAALQFEEFIAAERARLSKRSGKDR